MKFNDPDIIIQKNIIIQLNDQDTILQNIIL